SASKRCNSSTLCSRFSQPSSRPGKMCECISTCIHCRSGYWRFRLKIVHMTLLFDVGNAFGLLVKNRNTRPARPAGVFPYNHKLTLELFNIFVLFYRLLHSSVNIAKLVEPAFEPIISPGPIPTVAVLSSLMECPPTTLTRSFQMALKSYCVPSVFKSVVRKKPLLTDPKYLYSVVPTSR